MYPKPSFSGCLEPQSPLAGKYSQILHRSTLFTLIKTTFTAIFNANDLNSFLYIDAEPTIFLWMSRFKIAPNAITEEKLLVSQV
jgi:hypothetical protein